MVVSWLVFPLFALVVAFGCGLLVERAGGWQMRGVLVSGVGLAVIVVAADVLTESTALAPATPWVVVGLAVLGYAISIPRLKNLELDRWTLGLGIVLFGCFAAPFVASGHNTFGGYGVVGDPTFHFLVAQELLAHGHRSLSELPYPDATNVQQMQGYLATDYPFGSDLAAAALRPLVGLDLPWVYSPFIALVLTLGGLNLEELLRDVVRSRPLRGLCALIAAQAGLAYSFFLVSSIKELVTTWAISLLIVLVVETLRRPSARALIPLAVVSAAEIDILAVPAIPWIGPPLLAFAAVSLWRARGASHRPSPRTVAATAAVVAAGIALAWPILSHAVKSYAVTSSVLTPGGSASAVGDLFGPLKLWQILGIWPAGDFRTPIVLHATLIYVLLWIAALSAVGGAAWALRRRAWGPLLLLLGNGIAALALLEKSTPYAASKVEAILSITAVLAAMLGAVALHDLVHPAAGWTLAALVAIGVLWTNDKSLRVAPLAPQTRFTELGQIDHRFADKSGPTFDTIYDVEYPSYFLRDMGPLIQNIYYEPPTRPRTAVRTVNGQQLPWDPNDFTLSFLQGLRTIIEGRSPTVARPPADFRLVMQDRDYDVYRRVSTPKVLFHVSVAGSPLRRPQRVSCSRITALGSRAAMHHARLAYAPRLDLASVPAIHSIHPPTWLAYSPKDTPAAGGGLKLSTVGGIVTEKIRVPRTGRYTVWLGGTLSQRVTVSIGGQRVGSVSDQIGPGGLSTVVGSVTLHAGVQPVIMHRSGASRLAPVSSGDVLGSLVLTRTASPAPVRTVAPANARSLCGTRMQWLEIVR